MRPRSQTDVGGETGPSIVPPPGGATRTAVAVGWHWPVCWSPVPGTSGEKRASYATEPPGTSSFVTALLPGSGWTSVGSTLPSFARSTSFGHPANVQVDDEVFASASV